MTAATFDSTVTATAAATTATVSNSSSSSNGLSKGDIAGIAVGTIVGSLAIVAAAAFVMFRKRKNAAGQNQGANQVQPEMSKTNAETGSVASTH